MATNIFDMTDTWNNGGTVFNAIKMAVTQTASAAGSKIMNLLRNGVSQFAVDPVNGVTVGVPTGDALGPGKVNVSGGYYVNGVPILNQVIGAGDFPVFNDSVLGLIVRPIQSTDLPAAQFLELGAVKAKAQISGQALAFLDEGGAFGTMTVSTRETLTASRTYFVRTAPVPVTIDTSTDFVTWTAHGLIGNQEVYFTRLPSNAPVTVTIASPGVVTWTAHGLIAGSPFRFQTDGALPTGITAGAIYYVLAAGLTANTFQFALSPGGAAINTSGSQSGTHTGWSLVHQSATVTMTIASPAVVTWTAHGMTAGEAFTFTTTGALPTGVAPAFLYYVLATGLTANTFQFAASPGGAAINSSGAQSGVHTGIRGSSRIGTMPGGVTEGTAYFVVGSSVTADTFKVSATVGGGAIDLTGTAVSVYAQKGSDSNDGLSAATPFGTIQKCVDTMAALDFSTFNVTGNISPGTYPTTTVLKSITGDFATLRSAGVAMITTVGALCVTANAIRGRWVLDGFTFEITGSQNVSVSGQRGVNLDLNNVNFGANGGNAHVQATLNANILFNGGYVISGSGSIHLFGTGSSTITCGGRVVTLINGPQFTQAFAHVDRSSILAINGNTYTGGVTGPSRRFNSFTNGTIDTAGAALTYLPGTTPGFVDATDTSVAGTVPQQGAAGGVYA